VKPVTRRQHFAAALSVAFVAACTASPPADGPEPAGQAIAVVTAPSQADVAPGTTVQFAAQVTGTSDSSVSWSVDEAGGGTVGANGLYTAPATEGTYHVRAASAVASGSNAASVVRVKANAPAVPAPTPAVAISISPTTATLDACKGQVFTASVTNSPDTAVTWTVTEAGGGTVTNGAYTPPQSAGTYHVVATSVADSTKAAVATVTVGPEKVLSVAVVPGSGTVKASGALAFSASVTTTCGTFAAQ
jgi:hypothetical protein